MANIGPLVRYCMFMIPPFPSYLWITIPVINPEPAADTEVDERFVAIALIPSATTVDSALLAQWYAYLD
jgi:hypothetical protein